MKVRATSLFQTQKKALRRSQIRQLDGEIQKIINDPEIGDTGEEELEEIYYHRYEDRYGRMLIAYQMKDNELWLLVIAKISVQI